MLHAVKLLLPALVPSWRFFDVIAPSPRIQFALLESETDQTAAWQMFRPRPAHVSFIQMLARMLWNARWNESLFMVSCAERILDNPTPSTLQHSETEILNRIIHDLITSPDTTFVATKTHVQFRLLLIQRHDATLKQEVVFHSRLQRLADIHAT